MENTRKTIALLNNKAYCCVIIAKKAPIMLVQFSLKNFKCFKEEVKMSLIATNYDQTTREDDNVFPIEKFGLRLLNSTVIYGANASGKSKLFEGLRFMKHFILNSSKEGQIDEQIDVTPFLLTRLLHKNPFQKKNID